MLLLGPDSKEELPWLLRKVLIYDSLLQSAFSSPKKMPQCKLMGLSAFLLWGSRWGLLLKFLVWEKEPFQETRPAQDPKAPSLQSMAGLLPCILAGAEQGRG